MSLARPNIQWPKLDVGCKLTLKQKVPRLLLPRQGEGRVQKTGEAFVFDAYSFHGYNEYDTGSWNVLRHRLMRYKTRISEYVFLCSVSHREIDWGAGKIISSLRFIIGTASRLECSYDIVVASIVNRYLKWVNIRS